MSNVPSPLSLTTPKVQAVRRLSIWIAGTCPRCSAALSPDTGDASSASRRPNRSSWTPTTGAVALATVTGESIWSRVSCCPRTAMSMWQIASVRWQFRKSFDPRSRRQGPSAGSRRSGPTPRRPVENRGQPSALAHPPPQGSLGTSHGDRAGVSLGVV